VKRPRGLHDGFISDQYPGICNHGCIKDESNPRSEMNLSRKTKITLGVTGGVLALAVAAGGTALAAGPDMDGDNDGTTAAASQAPGNAAPAVQVGQVRPNTAQGQQPSGADTDGDGDGH
jgi:hypothetical protein